MTKGTFVHLQVMNATPHLMKKQLGHTSGFVTAGNGVTVSTN